MNPPEISANNSPEKPLSPSTRDPSDLEDLDWVEATLRGDSGAFARIYEKYRERVFRVLFGVVRNREDALEATQEVFVKIHRALPRFDPRARFFTWAYRIAVNQGIDMLRQRKVRKEQQYEEEQQLGESSGRGSARFVAAEKELERKEVLERLEAALETLSEEHRTVFLLYSYEGLSYGDIADVVGIPIGTVMSRLFYARKRMKEQLPREWDPGGPKRREKK